MRRKICWLIGIIGLYLLVLGGCSQKISKTADAKLKVVTTFYPIYEFTKQVTGNDAEVTSLIGAGVEPHDYEPSAKDMAKIMDADVFIYSSGDMETWVADVLKNIKGGKPKVIKASAGIHLINGTAEETAEAKKLGENGAVHSHTKLNDPHIWLDPNNAKTMVATISKGLMQVKGAPKANFKKQTDKYQQKLTKLVTEFDGAFNAAKHRTFVVQHAAFGYLARRYKLTQVSIAGLSPDVEPSPGRLGELKTFMAENKIKVIYVEETDSAKIAETLATEANVKTESLNPLEGLSNEEQAKGENYITVMQANLHALQATIK